jgi:small subunit ribosomal protein S13
VDLPAQKQVWVGLTYIFGIGQTRSHRILSKCNIEPTIKVKDLSEEEVRRIGQMIQEEGGVEGDLRKNMSMDIKRLMDIGSYRGMRHRRSLPCRGQRTHTNARTKKGPRRAIPGKKRAVGKKG